MGASTSSASTFRLDRFDKFASTDSAHARQAAQATNTTPRGGMNWRKSRNIFPGRDHYANGGFPRPAKRLASNASGPGGGGCCSRHETCRSPSTSNAKTPASPVVPKKRRHNRSPAARADVDSAIYRTTLLSYRTSSRPIERTVVGWGVFPRYSVQHCNTVRPDSFVGHTLQPTPPA